MILSTKIILLLLFSIIFLLIILILVHRKNNQKDQQKSKSIVEIPWCYNKTSKTCEQTQNCDSTNKTQDVCTKENWCYDGNLNTCSNSTSCESGNLYDNQDSCNLMKQWCYDSTKNSCSQTSGCNSGDTTKSECTGKNWCYKDNTCSNNITDCADGNLYNIKNDCDSKNKMVL